MRCQFKANSQTIRLALLSLLISTVVTVSLSVGPRAVVGLATSDVADREIAVAGDVRGGVSNTHLSDDTYQSIREILSTSGKPSQRTSFLEHKWVIDVTGGDSVTFLVEAHHTANSEGDHFTFSYSTDDVTFSPMLTITRTSDDDTLESFALPNTLSGSLYIRVRDSDQSPGHRNRDTVFIDQMLVVSQSGSSSNQAPSVDAGPDQVIRLPTDAVDLLGTVSDDGLPDPPGALSTVWAQVGGAGTVTFSDDGSLLTAVQFSSPGIYVLRLTAGDGELSAWDELTVAVLSDQAGVVGNVANSDIPVDGTATGDIGDTHASDDVSQAITEREHKKLTFLEHKWAIDVPPGGNATFFVEAHHTPNDEGDDFVFAYSLEDIEYTDMVTVTRTSDDDGYQSYVLGEVSGQTVYVRVVDADRSRGHNSKDTIFVDAMVIVCECAPPANQAPTVDAGFDQTVEAPNDTVLLDGTVTDDGLPNPPAAVTVLWAKVSGPGGVTFGDASQVDTTAQFAGDGIYVLRLTADDSEQSSYDETMVTVNPAGGGAPIDAGLNEPFQLPDPVTGVTHNILDYGATPGQDHDDDALAVQAAIDSARPGDEVFLPNGTYHVKTIMRFKTGVSIRGESREGSVIAARLSSGTEVFKASPGVNNFAVSDFSLTSGGGGNSVGYPIQVGGASPSALNAWRISFTRLAIDAFERYAITARNGKHILIRDCELSGATNTGGGGYGYGVMIGYPESSNNWIDSCNVGPPMRHAVVIQYGAHHNLVENSTGTDCVKDTFDLHGEGEYSNEFRFNTAIRSLRAGFGVGNTGSTHDASGPNNWIHHNETFGCLHAAEVIQGSHNQLIEDNYFHDASGDYPFGVRIYNGAGDNITVRGNDIINCRIGLAAEGSRFLVVEENRINNNSKYGILTDGATTDYTIVGNDLRFNGTAKSLGSADGIYDGNLE